MFNEEGSLHWASILTMLAMSLVSAWLVFFEGWLPKNAFAAVIGGSAAVLLIGVSVSVIFLGKGNRRVFIDEFWKTTYADFKHIRKVMFRRH